MRFIWDYDNITHIAEHDVTPEEAEQALLGYTLEREYQTWHTEDRFTEIGVTRAGRFLEIVTTARGDGIRVVTAYPAPRSAIREYLKGR